MCCFCLVEKAKWLTYWNFNSDEYLWNSVISALNPNYMYIDRSDFVFLQLTRAAFQVMFMTNHNQYANLWCYNCFQWDRHVAYAIVGLIKECRLNLYYYTSSNIITYYSNSIILYRLSIYVIYYDMFYINIPLNKLICIISIYS